MTNSFTCTSDAPYDRHTYKLYIKNGTVLDFDCYLNLQEYWFSHSQIPDYLDVVEVLDKPKRKEKVKASGFAH